MHNRNGNHESWALSSWETCRHCHTRGNGAGHVTVACTCGAVGVLCHAHDRVDWGDTPDCATSRQQQQDASDREDSDRITEENEAARQAAETVEARTDCRPGEYIILCDPPVRVRIARGKASVMRNGDVSEAMDSERRDALMRRFSRFATAICEADLGYSQFACSVA